MSPQQDSWMQQTEMLAAGLRRDLARIAERRSALDIQEQEIATKLSAVESVIGVYREKHDIEAPLPTVDPAVYQGLSIKDMIRRWAYDHGGLVAMKDVARALTAAGFFRDARAAQSALYGEVTKRMPDFRRTRPGVYELWLPGRGVELPSSVVIATGGMLAASGHLQTRLIPATAEQSDQPRISFRQATLETLRDAKGATLHARDILAAARAKGAITNARRPLQVTKLVLLGFEREGLPVRKVAPNLYQWSEPTSSQAS